MTLLRVEDLAKSYPIAKRKLLEEKKEVQAVDGISFEIEQGETFGLVGESGCGKSTTGQMIVRLQQQSAGRIYYGDQELTGLSKRQMKPLRRELQIVFQDPYSSLNPKKKIGWLLEEPLAIHRIGSRSERRKKALEALEQVGLDPGYADKYPHELSGGQRQRVGIASALVLNPKFMVIDEAVSALDVSVQAQILNLLKDLQRKFGLTYLFISHDLNVVEYMSDRIGVMYLGKIVEILDAGKGERPLHPYTQALFSSIPDASGGGKERIRLRGDVPSSLNPPSGCVFHTRCPYAMERCAIEVPKLEQAEDGRQVSCHLYAEGGSGMPEAPGAGVPTAETPHDDWDAAAKPDKEAVEV